MNVDNIVLGLQETNTVKIGAYGAVEGDAVDAGLIKGGVKYTHEEVQYEVKVDQFIGTVKKFITDESLKITLSFVEASLSSFAIAFGYPSSAIVGNKFSFGGKTTVTERSMFVNPKGPADGNSKLVLYKVVPTGKTSPAYTKEKETLIDVEFDVLVDTSKTAEGRFGYIEQDAADATPPTVALTTPADGGTVTKNTKGTVTWTITEANEVDENSIVYGATFIILNITVPATASLVAGTISYNAATKVVTFTPTSNWTASDSLQAIVSTGLKDAQGNALAATKIEQFSVTA